MIMRIPAIRVSRGGFTELLRTGTLNPMRLIRPYGLAQFGDDGDGLEIYRHSTPLLGSDELDFCIT